MTRTFAQINGWTLTLVEDVRPIELHLRHKDVLMAKALIGSGQQLRYVGRSDGKIVLWKVGASPFPFFTYSGGPASPPFIVKGTVDVPLIPAEEA